MFNFIQNHRYKIKIQKIKSVEFNLKSAIAIIRNPDNIKDIFLLLRNTKKEFMVFKEQIQDVSDRRNALRRHL